MREQTHGTSESRLWGYTCRHSHLRSSPIMKTGGCCGTASSPQFGDMASMWVEVSGAVAWIVALTETVGWTVERRVTRPWCLHPAQLLGPRIRWRTKKQSCGRENAATCNSCEAPRVQSNRCGFTDWSSRDTWVSICCCHKTP